MYLIGEISTRNQFGLVLNDRGLLGEAVEIGTHIGDFASVLLGSWRGLRLTCIDPWCELKGYENQSKVLPYIGGTGNRARDFQLAKHTLSIYKDRVRFIQATSEVAIDQFRDEVLDFVYIDGDHELDSVSHDVWEWWNKLRKGGILAGHDFICPGELPNSPTNWGRSIQHAVDNFAKNQGLDVHLVIEENGLPWSWYIFKP